MTRLHPGERTRATRTLATIVLAVASSATQLACSPAGGFGSAFTTTTESQVPDVRTHRLLADSTFEEIGAVTPDGKTLVTSDIEDGQLTLVDLATGTQRRLETRGKVYDPAWVLESAVSHDGRWVAYHEIENNRDPNWAVRVISIDGGESRGYVMPDIAWNPPMDWSPGGDFVLLWQTMQDGSERLAELDVESGENRILRSLPWGGVGESRYRPNGREIGVAMRLSVDAEDTDLYLLDRASGSLTPLVERPGRQSVLGWSPDGHHLLYSSLEEESPSVWRVAVENGRAGEPVKVRGEFWRSEPLGLDSQGRLFYSVSAGERQVNRVPLTADGLAGGLPLNAVTDDAPPLLRAQYSPDGTKLAVLTQRSTGASNRTIAVISLETRELNEFSLPAGFSYPWNVGWAPDGETLILKIIDDRNRAGLYRLDLATLSLDTLKVFHESGFTTWDVTPDGGAIVYGDGRRSEADDETRSRPDELDLRYSLDVLDLETGLEHTIYDEPGGIQAQLVYPVISPDGQEVAFLKRWESVHVVGMDGADSREVAQGTVHSLAWSADGQSLYYVAEAAWIGANATNAVWRVRADGSAPPERIGVEAPGLIHIDVRPDGRELTFSANVGRVEIWRMDGVFSEEEDGQ